MEVALPNFAGKKWINMYLGSVLVNLELANVKVVIDNSLKFCDSDPGCVAFEAKLNNKKLLIDLHDTPDEYYWKVDHRGFSRTNLSGNSSQPLIPRYYPEKLDMPIFKIAIRPDKKYAENVFPYGPFVVQYNKDSTLLKYLLNKGNIYNPFNSNKILKPAPANYPHTRVKAFSQINTKLLNPKAQFITTRVTPMQYWDAHGDCISLLNISGSGPHVVDKAPIEAMMLGVCIIHNDIDIKLPFNKQLEKNKHYLCLNEHYSDINEKINFLFDNRELLKDMGNEARNLIMSTSTPKARMQWMVETVEEYYD